MTAITSNVVQLSEFFKGLQSKAYLCDVAFIVGEDKTEVYGIKAILTARSSVFANLFQLLSIETNTGKKHRRLLSKVSRQKNVVHVIDVPSYTKEEFSALMEYIHCGVCDIGPKIVIGLFVAADEFNLLNLKRGCVSFLGQHITLDNTVYIFSELERFQSRDCANELEPLVFNFIRMNADIILSEATVVVLSKSQLIRLFCLEGLQLPEIKKFYAALIWTKAQMRKNRIGSSSLQSTFSPFLNYIKLTNIPIQSLVEDVRRSKVIPERLLAHACSHNKLKESFNLTSRKQTYHVKKREEAANYQQPFVVGIHSTSSSAQSLRTEQSKSDKRSNKKPIKIMKNSYDVSYRHSQGFVNGSSSNPQLTKSRKSLSSTNIETSGAGFSSSKADFPGLSSFRPKILRSSRLLISDSTNDPVSTPSRPKLTKASKMASSTPFLDIMF